MSTLRINTIENVAGSSSIPVATIASGTAKAWVNFNGTTSPGTIRASFNVSSVTKNGTGDYSINFSSSFTDTNYSVATAGNANTGAYNIIQVNTSTSPSVSSVRIASVTQSGGAPTAYDAPIISVAIFR